MTPVVMGWGMTSRLVVTGEPEPEIGRAVII